MDDTPAQRTVYYRAVSMDGDDEVVEVPWADVWAAIVHEDGDTTTFHRLHAGDVIRADGHYWHQQCAATTSDGPF
jgi:hypothetical protein